MLQEYQGGWELGGGGWGVGSLSFNVQGWWVGSLSFDVQGWWSLSRFGPIQTDRKRGEGEGGGVKIGHFSWMP